MYIVKNISGESLGTVSAVEPAECPRCRAELMFSRSPLPNIDSCGFESYRLACQACGAQLAGIIDPADEALLLSEIENVIS